MRLCLLDDLLYGARALQALPPHLRAGFADRMLFEAQAADKYTKRFGRAHADWGNGSLLGRAMAAPRASLQPMCFACVAIMADAISRFRQGIKSPQQLGLSP